PAGWPGPWNRRSLRSTTAHPSVTEGDVGSSPSFTRSGRSSLSFSARPPSGTISAVPDDNSASASAVMATGDATSAIRSPRLSWVPDEGPPNARLRDRRARLPLPGMSHAEPRRLSEVGDPTQADVVPVFRRREADHGAARVPRSRDPSNEEDPPIDPRRGRRGGGQALLPAPRRGRTSDPPSG